MAFRCADLAYRFDPQGPYLFQDVAFTLEKGQCGGLTGPNGSGKTTLGKIIMGILASQEGTLEVDGVSLHPLNLAQRGRLLGYVFQNPSRQIFNTTVEAEVAFGLEQQKLPADVLQKRVHDLLVRFDLLPLSQSFPYTLSQGERQRVALASILALNPPYFILDEPTTGLDPLRKQELMNYLKEVQAQGRGLLLISHDLPFIEDMAQITWVLKDGRLEKRPVRSEPSHVT